MMFASDNWSGASEPVIAALAAAARRGGPAYGADDLTKAVERRFADLFQCDVSVFLVASGTAANSLALSAFARPGGVVFAHREAHIIVDEAGATEFLGGGLKIVGLDGVGGKIAPAPLAEAIAKFPEGAVHHGQPVAVSLTNITELGQVYRPDEIAALAEVARARGLAVHVDGARFANAVAATDTTPGELTWRAGVDVISFGGTKNGCIAAEAVVFFDKNKTADVAFRRQRAGQGFSKNWFIAAQLDAYLTGGHWLELARHSNTMAARLAEAISATGVARPAILPGGNEVFVVTTKAAAEKLRAAGGVFYEWTSLDSIPVRLGANEILLRLVTSWQTKPEDVERFVAALR